MLKTAPKCRLHVCKCGCMWKFARRTEKEAQHLRETASVTSQTVLPRLHVPAMIEAGEIAEIEDPSVPKILLVGMPVVGQQLVVAIAEPVGTQMQELE